MAELTGAEFKAQCRAGNLRLDSKRRAMKGGDSGPVIGPGKAGESLLIQRISGSKLGIRMPPTGALPSAEITALRDWIDQGRSLLLASHLLNEVESITESFLLIYGGRLLASGTAEEVHQLLADVPNEIAIRTNYPHRLAGMLVQKEVTDSLKIDDGMVTVATRHPHVLYANLPAWLDDTDITISEMRSADESLQALFNSLMKIHRGEL